MDIEVRAMTPEERKYSYTQDADTIRRSGCIGHLRVDMDTNGTGFFSSWDNHNAALKTQDFKDQFDAVINALRFDEQYGGILKNRSSLASCCSKTPESDFGNDREFGFRVDTEEYSYMLRLNPNRGEYAAYIYAYDRELLDGDLLPAPELMNVLVVVPGEKPYVKAIKTELESLYRELDTDTVQAIYPWEEPVALICDENGKLTGKELNRALRDEDGDVYDIVAGTFLITGLGEEDFASLSPEHIEKFKERFAVPEAFLRVDGKIMIVPILEQEVLPPKLIPVYLQSGTFAREHGELDTFRASYKANVACKDAIENAIAENYRDNRLNTAGAHSVIEQFGMERTMMVLANTVQHKDWDGRFSDNNKAWAESIVLPAEDEGGHRNNDFVVNKAHPGLTDLFVNQVRREAKELTNGRKSVLGKLKDAASALENGTPSKKPREAER